MLVDDSDNVSFKSNVMFMKIWQTPKYEIFLSKKLWFHQTKAFA